MTPLEHSRRYAGPRWYRRASLLLPILALCLLQTDPATAAKRVALVVGNGAYGRESQLVNPPNDAADMASALSDLDFDVITGIDLDKRGFDGKLREFSRALAGADVALFFYAGHGLQAKGVNHLIPTDATIANEYDLQLETITLDAVLTQMEQAKSRIVILDACRNNPFARTLARSMGSRSVNENLGLAISLASGLDTFIAYATQPGNVAGDGTGRNSPFTAPLKVHIRQPGVSLTDLMILVRHDVVTATEGAQVPWDHSALLGKFYFKEGPAVEPDAAQSATGDAAEAWGWIKNTTDVAILEEFIRRYGATTFGATARQKLEALQSRQPQARVTVIPNIKDVSLRPVQPSFDCKVHYKDSEVTVCNNPELSILDNELDRVYGQASRGRGGAQREALTAQQRQWLAQRDSCSTDVDCLAEQYRARIRDLAALPSQGAAANAQPSFDCKKHYLPAEVAICSNADLARLDVDLDKAYSQTSRGLSTSRRQALVMEQRQWLRGRDTCGSNVSCIGLQYQARLGQLQTWR